MLVKVNKGIYLFPDKWKDDKTLEEYKKRITTHKMDVGQFFKDSEVRTSYKGVCVCVCVCVCETVCVCE